MQMVNSVDWLTTIAIVPKNDFVFRCVDFDAKYVMG